jgi:ectoine hydroxylase
MTPEQILSIAPKVLSQTQREQYFTQGYLLLPQVINDQWLTRLRDATNQLVERGRTMTKSDKIFDFEPGHSAAAPRLRRVSNPVEQLPVFWEYITQAIVPDIVADLVGPDVKFHHSKLNFKWAAGGEEVKWHYDIGFWPHTNYSPLTIGTYLYDCGMDQGPLAVMPGSHNMEPLPSQYDATGKWVGPLFDRPGRVADLAQLPDDAQFAKKPVRSWPAIVAVYLVFGRCNSVHRQPDSLEVRPGHLAR